MTDRQDLMHPEHDVWTADGCACMRLGTDRLALRRWTDGTCTASARSLVGLRWTRSARGSGPVSALAALTRRPREALLAEALTLDDVRALTDRVLSMEAMRRPRAPVVTAPSAASDERYLRPAARKTTVADPAGRTT